MIDYELGEWADFALGRKTRPSDEYITRCFPNEAFRDEYLSIASARSDEEVRGILRIFLGESRSDAFGDSLRLSTILRAFRAKEGEEKNQYVQSLTEYDRRVLRRQVKNSSNPTLEGLTWVLDLLPHAIDSAIESIRAYTLVHAQHLSDLAYSALVDAIDLIRAKYITQGSEDVEVLISLILGLSGRSFEFLAAALYRSMGFDVEVTPAQKDGGKDVIARRTGEVIFIECKNSKNKVPVDVVASLVGRVEMARATRGILIGMSGFTSGDSTATAIANDYAARILLMNGVEFVEKLNEHVGPRWHLTLEHILNEERSAQSLSQL